MRFFPALGLLLWGSRLSSISTGKSLFFSLFFACPSGADVLARARPMKMADLSSVMLLGLLLFIFAIPLAAFSTPLNCSDTTRLCTSFLAIKSRPNLNLSLILSMFDVFPGDVTVDNASSPKQFFIRKNCSCQSPSKNYLTSTTFTVRAPGLVYPMVSEAYGPLALISNSSHWVRSGTVLPLRLLCGCSSGLWNYLMTYVLDEGETIGSLASQFGVSMSSLESANGIVNPNDTVVGEVYYIPLNSVPGEPYALEEVAPPAAAPAPSASSSSDEQGHSRSKFPSGWLIGSLGAALFLILLLFIVFLSLRSPGICKCFSRTRREESDERRSQKSIETRKTSSFCSWLTCPCFITSGWRATPGDARSDHIDVIRDGMAGDPFEMEKPVVFSYQEIIASTNGFSEANLLGHGTYGSVYHGVLQEQEVAIKRMSATKTKEFTAEMKVLCKVHHASLVELIGYAATGDELFLVYEYAQKGSLRNHLHDPHAKGYTSLSWIARVQIAVDAAKGLEYIHEHTKMHYVHRDIKTSNILLDASFRAKISDFGLSKLIGKAGEVEASATRVVGTFGYLAPEYWRDGRATTKSDVYAFGVVLFELISGKEAIIRSDGVVLSNADKRSLVSVMLAALRNTPSSMNMSGFKRFIDPNLMDLYPHDCVFKMAMLAKQCVDEDPILRPDMKQVVISLSHILLSSIEWEAILAGNSQVFSGLVQGR
ncbi:protein kinase family protein / peptidoglycan-binding LysM domain-containing protein [Wolffia australiana]